MPARKSKAENSPPHRPRRRVSAVVCARWETQYIQEWLLYHRSINVDHVYIYCNDDSPEALYREVMPFLDTAEPFVTFHHFPFKGQQYYMYMHFLRTHMQETEWFVFLDVDEFLRLPPHNDIQRFLDQVPPHWDAVYFNWLFYNNNGFVTRPAGSVLLNYTRRDATLHSSTKTMTRSARVNPDIIVPRQQMWHHWWDILGKDAGLFNVLGHRMQEYFAGNGSEAAYLADPNVQERFLTAGCIHHYAFKSEEDFLLRYQRGTSGDFDGQSVWKEAYDRAEAPAFLARLGKVNDPYLADYWRGVLGRVRTGWIARPPSLPNIALGQPALQSSLSEWSRGKTIAEDACGAVNGTFTGSYQFHTDNEHQPWWQVDLASGDRGLATIHEIWLHNRVENTGLMARCSDIAILLSDDALAWTEIHRRQGLPPYGGADGNPLQVQIAPATTARYVRVMLLGTGLLHLDQVEVYGQRGSRRTSPV